MTLNFDLCKKRALTLKVFNLRDLNLMFGISEASVKLDLTGETILKTLMFWQELFYYYDSE